jgi:hypothetical protein
LQSWVPLGQLPSQAASAAMQEPAHSFWPSAQRATQRPPSHSTLPETGCAQGSQALPQVIGSSSLTQLSPHR